ncbi:MAG TPA: TetR/AcrR family transcriptional regulator C-terminal domain-containing protein [Kofleriaceae bacterium]|nr:TetR/AcrR family transcriptional regulator C-terminal domain-containing protein [Kofleriaceae bacterium]
MKRRPLTREAILDAAVELLDRHGLEKLSMRRLGAALGVEAMSLYNHIPDKRELLDGIHERILLSLETPGHTRSWQAYARHQAVALHRALLAHPHAIPLFATRPAATPAAIERLDRYLEVLLGAGFKPLDALSVVQLVAQLVVGHAMWTNSVEVIVIDEPAPPHVQQVERVLDRWSPDRELELGIDALLHGFERLL